MVKYDFESMTYMSNRLMTFSGQHAQTTGTGQYQLMKKAPDKHRSGQTELIACAFLLGEGYEVFRNVSACGPIDLIACKGMETRRIEVGGLQADASSGERRDRCLVCGRERTV